MNSQNERRLHELCDMNYTVRIVNNSDDSCFYWSLILALQLLPPGSSYDQIELNPASETLQLIRDIRQNIFDWWRAQKPVHLYHPKRSWMVSVYTYMQYAAMNIVLQMRQDNFLIEEVCRYAEKLGIILSNDEATNIAFVQRIQTAINDTLEMEIADNTLHIDMMTNSREKRLVYYEYLRNWRKQCPMDDQQRHVEVIDDDRLKSIVENIIWLKANCQFSQLRIREYGNRRSEGKIRFYADIFNFILDLTEGAFDDEYIAIAALYHKKLFFIPQADYPKHNKIHRDYLRFNSDKWVRAFGTSVTNPFFITYVAWVNAKSALQNGTAIAVTDVGCDNGVRHTDAVCKIEMPSYILPEQLRVIEDTGYILRSLCNLTIEKGYFMYALMLACEPMKPEFRYCCTPIYRHEFNSWYEREMKAYDDWLASPNNFQTIIDAFYNDETRRSNFVYEGRDDEEYNGNPNLTGNLYLDQNRLMQLKFPLCCDMWESAIVFSYILKRNIFVVRGQDRITRYGPPSLPTFPTHVCRAEWIHVIEDLKKNECVCCFTRGTWDKGDDDFDVTHVILPSSSSRKRALLPGTSRLISPRLRGTGDNVEKEKEKGECMCHMERTNCSRKSSRVISLAEAERLMTLV